MTTIGISFDSGGHVAWVGFSTFGWTVDAPSSVTIAGEVC
jgi:hypothetical protein